VSLKTENDKRVTIQKKIHLRNSENLFLSVISLCMMHNLYNFEMVCKKYTIYIHFLNRKH